MKKIGFATLLLSILAQGGALKAQGTTDDIDVRAYGALCDGTNDDASAINAALTAAGSLVGARVMLPPGGRCLVGATLNVPAHVTLAGHGWGNGGDLRARFANMTVVSLNGPFTGVKDIWINSSLAGPNASGTGIAMGNNQHQNVDHVLITGAFTGLDINGNTVLVDDVFVSDLPAHGIGWTIGRLGTFANTVDVRITNSTVEGNANADFNQLIYDAGGLQEINNDLIAAQYGTYIRPGANQWVVWTNFSNTVVGDTNVYGALSIDTAASSARIAGMECTGCWAASQTNGSIGANILINNSAGGTIDGLHFVGLRNYNGAGFGAYIAAGTNISFDDSHFCGMGVGKADIAIAANVSNLSVTGGQLGSNCDSMNAGATRGVYVPQDCLSASARVGLGSGRKDQRLQYRVQMLEMQKEALAAGLASPRNIFKNLSAMVRDAGLGIPTDYFRDPTARDGPPPAPAAPDPALVKAQAEAEAQRQRLTLERQKAEADLLLGRQQGQAKLDAVREESALRLQLERDKAAAETALAERRMALEFDLAERRFQAELVQPRRRGRGRRSIPDEIGALRDGGALDQ